MDFSRGAEVRGESVVFKSMLELLETVKKLLINCKSKLQTTMQLLKEVILYILILEGALRHQSENIKEKSFRKCEQYDTTCVQIQNKTRKKTKNQKQNSWNDHLWGGENDGEE